MADKFTIEVDPDKGTIEIATTNKSYQVLLDEPNETIKIYDGVSQEVTINRDTNVLIKSSGSYVDIKKDTKVITESQRINLGATASHPVVYGDLWKTLFNNHVHIGNLGSPTSPPTSPATSSHHSSKTYTD